MSAFIIIIAIVYTLFLLFISIQYLNYSTINYFELESEKPVSIIICARNEEKTIAKCLLTILQQDYPKNLIEIVVINDASIDNTKEIAEKMNLSEKTIGTHRNNLMKKLGIHKTAELVRYALEKKIVVKGSHLKKPDN